VNCWSATAPKDPFDLKVIFGTCIVFFPLERLFALRRDWPWRAAAGEALSEGKKNRTIPHGRFFTMPQ
jgi:hypothetical protein